jgi:periplasmic protein CpxP/Spy
MQTRNLALLLGACLTTGACLAQQADPNQTPAQAPAATAQQTAPSHPRNPDKQAKHLGKQLGLTRDQVAQIRPILADRQQQFQALQADTSLNPQDRRAKRQAIQQDSKAKIEAVLNDTQKQQYEQMLAERRAHRKNQQQAPQTQAQPGQ